MAWDNLQEAKSVLQQIENKLNFEEDDLLPEPSIRKGLQCEAFACSAKGPGSISKRGGSPQRPTSLRRCGLDKRSAPNPKCTPSSSRTNDSGKFNCLLENCHSSRRMFWNERTNPLYNDVIDQDIPLSGVNQTTEAINQDLNGNPSTGAIPTRLHVLVDVDLMENDWFMTGKQEGYRGSSRSNRGHLKGTPPVGPGNNLELDCSFKRRILQEKKSSPGPSVRTSFLSPPRSPFTQQLEPLLSKSPGNKLERLKERIRKQRKLQKKRQLEGSRLNLTQEQPIAVLGQKIGDPFKIGSMKCLVRKVTFGPPAPAYKGFNAIELMSDKKSSAGGEETAKASAVNTRASRRELVRRRDWGLPEQRRNSLKNPSRNHEATHKAQSFSKSPSPKRTAKVEGPQPSAVFAWREGQKLVRMLLGPPSKLPNCPAMPLDAGGRNDRDPPDEQAQDPGEHAQSTLLEKSPRRRLYIANEGGHCPGKTGQLDPDQSGLETMRATGILDGLQSAGNFGRKQNSNWKMGNGSSSLERGSGVDSPRARAGPEGHKHLSSRKGERGSPSPGGTRPPRNCTPRPGSGPGGRRSLSPPRSRACSPGANEENQGAGGPGTEGRLPSPLARSHNAGEVREYMDRQLAERRRKEREARRSVKQAVETKKKRLQEVYRKQREAFSKRKRGKQRGTVQAQHLEHQATKQENKVGAAEAIKDQAPVQSSMGPGDLEESWLSQRELSYAEEPFHRHFPGQSDPLRLEELRPDLRSPEWLSPPRCLPLPACRLRLSPRASREGDVSGEAAVSRAFWRGTRQQRIAALRSTASALSGRTESEAERLGVGAAVGKSPGGQGGGRGRAEPGGSTPAHGGGLKRPRAPGTGLDASPRAPAAASELSPAPLRKGQGADAAKGKAAEIGAQLEVEELMDELLCSSSSPSEDFLWSDSRPLTGLECCSKPREAGETQSHGQKELVTKCADVRRSFGQGDQRSVGKARTSELAFEAVQREHRSPGGRSSQETGRVQDSSKSSLAQKSNRLSWHWSAPRTRATSPPGTKLMVKGEQPAMAEHDCNHVSELFPRSSGLSSARNGKPSDSSRPSTSPRRLVKGKEDPVTQRLAELMQQLQEETEQLSFRCRARSSLTEDFATELNRSTMISPVITETTEYLRRSTGRRASAETSRDSKESVSGTSHISLADGSPGKELVEQSFWSLLPSESHWRRTMESNKMLQSGDDNFRSTTDQPFRKCQEAGMPIFGSQDAFSRFTLEMAQQYLKEEELRSRHQTALFRLRERALREKTKAELAWLEHQKTHLRDKGQDDKMPAIIRKQREILVKLQQEKAEIRHLQNVYRAAHQERKLLLKQQQEIFRIHQTTAHLQSQLVSSSTGPRVSGMKATLSDAAAINQSGPPASSDPGPGTPDWDVRSSSPLSGSESEGSVAMEQLRKMYGWLDERFLTKKEKELVRRRRQAEDLLEWKQRLDEEELAVDRIETEAVVAWSPQSQEQVPGMRPPVTATDHWDDEEGAHSRESKKPLGTGKVVTSAADVPLDEQIRGPQNAKPPTESLAQMSTIVLEPSEKSAKEVAEIQADKGLPIAEMATEPTVRETCTSPLRRELANREAMMGNVWIEQKRRQRERLKREEAELCRQLEAYDAFISKTRAELISDTDFDKILKPHIKTPTAAQHKPRMVFLWPQRSNILKHAAKPSAEVLQSQDLPSKRGVKAEELEKVLKPQEVTGSVDMSYPPGKSEIDDKPSLSPVSQPPPSSEPVDGIQSAEKQPETLAPRGSPQSSGNSDIEPSDSSGGCKAENPQRSKSDDSACSGPSNDPVSERCPVVLEAVRNVIISPSKLTESWFGGRSWLHPNNAWNEFGTESTDDSSQTSAHHLLKNSTNRKAEQSSELENIQPTDVERNTGGREESWFGLPHHAESISGFRPLSNHRPPLEWAPNEALKAAGEAGGQETIAAESPLAKDDSFSETPPSWRSACFLDKSAVLASGQSTPGSISQSAEVLPPRAPLSYIDDFSSTEENSGGQDHVSLPNQATKSSVQGITPAKEKFPPSLEQADWLRGAAVEDMALCRANRSPIAEDIASNSDGLPPLNDQDKSGSRHSLPPVIQGSLCKDQDLDVSGKGVVPSALEDQSSLVEEISSISEELLSPIEEDSVFNIKELSSPVDELMLYESEALPPPAEGDISFETEDFPPPAEDHIPFETEDFPPPAEDHIPFETEDFPPPAEDHIPFETEDFLPPPEEVILCVNEDLLSPFGENAFVRVEDQPPLSVTNSLIRAWLPSLGDEHDLLDTDELTPFPPPPIEEMDEESKHAAIERCGHPLRTGGEEETSSQFGGEDPHLPESSRIPPPPEGQQAANPLGGFNIGDRVLVSQREPGTLRFKGHTSFGRVYWAGVELDKPKGDHDGTVYGVKYFECMNKCGIFVAPDKISHLWADDAGDTDVTDSEDPFSDGPSPRNYRSLGDELKEAHSLEEGPEGKANEEGNISQLRGKKTTLHQHNPEAPGPGGIDEQELERITLECAKAVESFVGSRDMPDAGVEAKLHLDAQVSSEGSVRARALQRPPGKDSDVTEQLTKHLGEGTSGQLSSIGEQHNQSTNGTRGKRVAAHRITQDCSKLTQQNRGPLEGQRDHGTPCIDGTDLLGIDCTQLKDQIRVAKGGCSQETVENVTENLITKFVAKEYTKIKRRYNGNLEAKNILCPQTAVDCLTRHVEVLNAGMFGNGQPISNGEPKGPQPFQGSKTRGQMFVSDQWCSGPWRQSKETVFVVPHNLAEVQQLVEEAFDALWNRRGQRQGGDEIDLFEASEETAEMDDDAESKGVYKQAIFDLTANIFQNLSMKEPKAKRYPWMKHRLWASHSSGHAPNTEDKSELKSFIQRKVTKLLNLDGNDLETRGKLQKLMKYGKSQRDRVDIILIQELHEEESQWVEYADDELAVKMKLTEDIFNILIHDTVDVLDSICDRRSLGRALTA